MESAPLEEEEERRDTLALPPAEVLREIERKQNARAKEIRERRAAKKQSSKPGLDAERTNAAEVIQSAYRGHRERRALRGFSLDPSTRWIEALKDADFQTVTTPLPNSRRFTPTTSRLERVRSRWAHAGAVAKRAGSDDTSEEEEADSETQREAQAKRRRDKAEREKYARVMGLEYFLEMVDQKHRYGSNLRRYHQEWKKSDTNENFFYWLDYGEGKELDLEDRPRERLDKEQVRYLSRDERKKYLVNIDQQGRFCWAKNGKPITTSPDFKDSIEGIVHSSDETPTWREVTTGEKPEPSRWGSGSDSSSIGSTISTGSHEDGSKYVNEELSQAKGLNKLNHVNVDTIMNHLLRKTTKKNTWIFVADTSFRLYVGIKQSGAFQHSSFLKGARVSAAGLIKIKRGQIRKLSPLSGHYAPPVKNFRGFLRNLKQAGADLTHLNVSRSYAVILGLEGYVKVKKRGQTMKQGVKDMVNPEEKRRREEAERDKSESAEKERQLLARQERERRSNSLSHRLMKRVGISADDAMAEGETSPSRSRSPTRAMSPILAMRTRGNSGAQLSKVSDKEMVTSPLAEKPPALIDKPS